MPGRRVYVRTLERALRIIGKEEALAELLWVSPGALRRYLGGEARPPDDVFLKAADIVFNHAWGAAASRGEPAERASNIGRIDRNRDTVRSSARIISASARLLEATQAARAEAEALRGFKHRLFDRDYRPEDQHDVLQTGLDAALSATGTDVGDIELVDARGELRIAAWRGFPQELLPMLDGSSEEGSACRLAFAEHTQIVIADVTSHPLYVGTRALETLRAADVHALCATPLVTSAGVALGTVATHFHERKTPDARQLAVLGLVARGTAARLSAVPAVAL
jgi:hypothetical protein